MASRSPPPVTAPSLQALGVGPADAQAILDALSEARAESDDAAQVWSRVSRGALHPGVPFPAHRAVFDAVYAGWDAAARGPPPVWLPLPAEAAATNAARFAAAAGLPDWRALHRQSVDAPELFWRAVLERAPGVRLRAPPARILQPAPAAADPDGAVWLPGAALNIAEAALLGPPGTRPDAPALLCAAEATPRAVAAVSRRELAARAQRCAHALRAAGVAPGDAVAVVAPMGADAVAAYLGVVLAGCAAVSVAESFAAPEVAARLRASCARLVLTQDYVVRGGRALPLYERVAAGADAPRAVVLRAEAAAPGGEPPPEIALRAGDAWWHDFLAAAPEPAGDPEAFLAPHVGPADALSGILFSSGTTGEPKAVPWTHATPLRAAADGHFHQDVRRGDVVAWPTSLGWMMGPWLVYAALLNGAAAALFAGAPGGRPFGEFVAAARVTQLGLVPSLARGWRASGCMAGLDWAPHLRCFSSTGEASAPEEYHWLVAALGRYRAPVVEYCGGTEIGGAFLAGTLVQPQAAACFSTPAVGAALVLLPRGGGPPAPHGGGGGGGADAPPAAGELALRMPMLGASQRLLNRDHFEVYFRGMPPLAPGGPPLRRHGDEVERLAGGYYRALGRADDAMNLGGIKVASAELERAVAGGLGPAAAAEVAAVAVPPPGGGPDALVLVVVPPAGGGAADAAALAAAAQATIAARLNPLFRVARVVLRRELPRTATGKVMRRELRAELAAAGGGGAPDGGAGSKL